jgi:hypothetical protein
MQNTKDRKGEEKNEKITTIKNKENRALRVVLRDP